ncbi:hypothetical protein G6O69_35505 [Pseudenhygromyxa sp. WMMC2535]|uniref:hypothetical protein n=1 Tax=Pseudenhygromyxa sp. WMMC2535 TaxID=2712867 RepID=UPI001595D7DE|nr:hypothetical protein [Pseudenhygromyxa sp. WMMC2535]NVB43185.1 hypothetical protein [Pseudenhygromyxa sp. WMMC2535]
MYASKRALLPLLTVFSLACGDSSGSEDDDIGGTEAETETETGSSGDMEGESGSGESTSGEGSESESTSGESSEGESSESEGESSESEGESSESEGESSESEGESSESEGESSETEGESSETEGCLDEEIACDGLDEDCDGTIDNVDIGQDGFCDCYKIGIIGNQGANAASNFEAWLEDKGTVAERFGTSAVHQLTAAELANYDILIVDHLTHIYSADEQALLQQWIEDGQGMITMAGYDNVQADRDRQNSLAAASGLSYVAPIYLSPTEEWLEHEITEGTSAVQIYGGWPVSGSGEVFVRPSGEPNVSLGTTTTLGDGTVIVFADEWISFDSEWQAIPEVEVFWSNMIEWVGPKSFCVEPQ